MRTYTTEEIECARVLIAAADREFSDYSRTDLLLDNVGSLLSVEDARGLLVEVGLDLRPGPR
ncbi:hypothetical protein [Mycobacteroides abscessus]|uniref:Uncharacterized protein n=1 Tax=Mycobacteroides abscessus subsp. massiliense TaxID=1962118 RepID=A0A1U2EXY8_9MYCO|nr:hypothetical protein [Mycobacteroides abscessus]SKM83590.1 Uncharacterised protein [Mycobacteroides abscessus subsp. massiliense]SKT61861.1 Uncharacterised protein [Mycobacteroides abscessus subsp. massiliense]SKT89983.1 Uncharacterised protein [Mycobacteroides abscessus subsp. massiliense]SKX38883.1 Uncharacterised protein [Mycobacteroides abscessus subsp. massiliense]